MKFVILLIVLVLLMSFVACQRNGDNLSVPGGKSEPSRTVPAVPELASAIGSVGVKVTINGKLSRPGKIKRKRKGKGRGKKSEKEEPDRNDSREGGHGKYESRADRSGGDDIDNRDDRTSRDENESREDRSGRDDSDNRDDSKGRDDRSGRDDSDNRDDSKGRDDRSGSGSRESRKSRDESESRDDSGGSERRRGRDRSLRRRNRDRSESREIKHRIYGIKNGDYIEYRLSFSSAEGSSRLHSRFILSTSFGLIFYNAYKL